MIKKNTFIVTIIILALIILTNFYQINFNRGVITQLIDQNDSLRTEVLELSNNKGFNVHSNMLQIELRQSELNKAINNEDWNLANYQILRLKELFTQFEIANYNTEGKNISELTQELTNSPLTKIIASIEKSNKQDALNASLALERSCNACHSLSGKEFLNKK
ncbi:hypothetical protein [Marinigracilibium pacificum]|uniref:Cytochrome c n=1 Tax=Marinigracilibium pacificum TaxID=2729599 RepID=A0A848J0D2_9BACT|nr:hypothetical protein [Marinigracilibium pacificum]NMM48010.1 hypothetical protein [Marinigracilibium pacificum]